MKKEIFSRCESVVERRLLENDPRGTPNVSRIPRDVEPCDLGSSA
jgi:hypothetical protein